MTVNEKLSRVVIYLLKGILYQDKQPELWNALLTIQVAVQEYLSMLGLELLVDESEGFAFLRQAQLDGDEDNQLPRLIQRRALSYSVSLLCILLRKKMIQNDSAGGSTRIIITSQQIFDAMSIYLPDRSNEVKTREQIEVAINKLLEFGFLRRMKNDMTLYEVQRIIKAFVDADWLLNIENKLKEYQHYAELLSD